jgi:rhodanese-related sulfurtransferase
MNLKHYKRVNRGKMKKIIFLTVLATILGLGSVHGFAQDELPRISIQELKKMMDNDEPVTIIDVQPKEVYEMGHIKGAISIPWKSQIALEDVWSLPGDQLIVTYCDCGPGEADSADVADQLFQMGYESVKVLGDPSIEGWREAGYPMEKK